MAGKRAIEAQGDWLAAVQRLNEPGDKYIVVGISLVALIYGMNDSS